MIESVVVAGAGQTAAVAARTLRRRGFEGRVVLVGAEPHVPYQRPPLSKEYLAGEDGRDELYLLTPDWCESNGVELRLGAAATAIRPAERSLELADGSSLRAGALLIATGGRPRRLPGIEGDRVRYLRTIEDADRLRAELRPGARVVVIGAGFVGCEVASTAIDLGARVTLVEQAGRPLAHVLGDLMGDVMAALLRTSGVDLRTGEKVEGYTETASGAVVTTSGGASLEADVVVVGAGMVPNVEAVTGAGIETAGGIPVDEYCRTSVDGVYAAGDVALQWRPELGRRVRAEHFDNANAQGMAAAKNILGGTSAHTAPPWFWSDQFGRNLQHAGHCDGADRIVVRGRVEDFDFVAFYLAGGVLRGAFGVDRGGDLAVARQLIGAGAAPDPDVLRDEDADLTEIFDTL
ncbi:Dicamba O-demethylase 1, ferredoxin reductase component [Actinomadura sp. RB99]|jgi:3-phenylpropionate/trans-cinnamate dioxygenase ferredoxin reductase subunit|uniref:NAD(P)/FAD-dependent oxidoreductase n=1 Tax=Actinomadura sp. RB99 TaxID=2691577 RepID=UPI0016883F13|nr:FAD-dependent oxidoreductase [Actinomadura sp. RB99]MBD2892081.1 Dicamba O-demethylase 1, ferredoxin reductase component [Actinomadura sp. RB99]